jgi:hypothetical protein
MNSVPRGRLRVAQHAVLGTVWVGPVPEGRLKVAQDASPGIAELCGRGQDAQDCVLGYFQPSLAGLVRSSESYPALRAGLLSAVPAGLNL